MPRTEPLAETAHPTGRRASPRARICLPARLEAVSGVYAAQLVNLSCAGAAAALDAPLKPGMDVVVKCGPIDAFGVVIWARDGRCGIEFDEPIETEVVVAARTASEHKDALVRAAVLDDAKAWAAGKN